MLGLAPSTHISQIIQKMLKGYTFAHILYCRSTKGLILSVFYFNSVFENYRIEIAFYGLMRVSTMISCLYLENIEHFEPGSITDLKGENSHR